MPDIHTSKIAKGRCMYHKCTERSEYILFLKVGEHKQYRTQLGCMCQKHAELELEYYNSREKYEAFITKIDVLNESNL